MDMGLRKTAHEETIKEGARVVTILTLHSARVTKFRKYPTSSHTEAVERDFNDRKLGRGTR